MLNFLVSNKKFLTLLVLNREFSIIFVQCTAARKLGRARGPAFTNQTPSNQNVKTKFEGFSYFSQNSTVQI
jgi:hypothetical protein